LCTGATRIDMKRFYKTVTVCPAEGGFQCKLDDRDVKTPMGKLLVLPTQPLAEKIAAEWDAQVDVVKPQAMHLTQIATTARDKIEGRRNAVEQGLLRFTNTDLIFYFAENEGLTAQIAQRQEAQWRPWISWMEEKIGAKLATTTALKVLEQDPAFHDFMKSYLSSLSDLELCVFQILTSESGSLVLSMGFMEGKLGPKHLLEISNTEDFFKNEIYNIDFYGQDPYQEKKWVATRQTYEACRICLDHAKP